MAAMARITDMEPGDRVKPEAWWLGSVMTVTAPMAVKWCDTMVSRKRPAAAGADHGLRVAKTVMATAPSAMPRRIETTTRSGAQRI